MRPLAAQRVARQRSAGVFAGAVAAADSSILAASSNLLAAFLALLTRRVVQRHLHADEAPLAARDAGRRCARRAAADDRMGRRARRADARKRGRCSPSFSCGRFRISWRSRGCIAPISAARVSRCCPVVEPTGRSTARQAVLFSLVLVPLSLVPYFLHMSGPAYAVGAAAGSVGLSVARDFVCREPDRRSRAAAVFSDRSRICRCCGEC